MGVCIVPPVHDLLLCCSLLQIVFACVFLFVSYGLGLTDGFLGSKTSCIVTKHSLSSVSPRPDCVRSFALTQSEDHKNKIALCLNVRHWVESFGIIFDDESIQ